MKQLTEKQRAIYDYLVRFITEYGYPPSVREIAAAVGLKSPSTVHFHLKALEEAGAIRRGAGKTRSITTEDQALSASSRYERVPLLGTVAAGTPILAEQCVEDYILFDTQGRSGEHFALRIRGDSMVNAGILDGDCVIVHRQSTARSGEIVIALLEDEATCKRLYLRGGRVLLLPENNDYHPIDGTDAKILGKVVALIRAYR